MIPYIALSLSPVLWGILASLIYQSSRNIDKERRLVVVLSGISIFVMIALRSQELGSQDSAIYYQYWETLSRLSFQELVLFIKTSRLEVGFLGVCWLLSHIPCFVHPQYVFVFSGLIITIAYCRFILKYCDDVILGLTIFICLGLYSFLVQGMRQAIAMSICLMGIPFCGERKLIKFACIVAVAMLFHKVACVFLVVYFLYNRRMDTNTLLVTIGISILIIVFSNKILGVANDIFDMSYGTAVESGGGVAVAIYAITLMVAWLFRGRNQLDKDYCFFFYITFLGGSLYVLRYIGALAIERVSFFFMAGQLVTLPNALRSIKNGKALATFAIWTLSILLFLYRQNGSAYYFFWQ